ncbi:MAG: hypothetical protein L3J51_04055 [Cocleimonas sp.]|nr:hypothetical protein [Cocleimonas sp.]
MIEKLLIQKIRSSFITSVIIILGLLTCTVSYAESNNTKTIEKLLKASNIKANGEYMRSQFLSFMKQPFDQNDNKKKALIIGDSYAQDFFNSVSENHYLNNYQIRTRYIPVRCQIFLGNESARLINPKDKAFCDKSDTLEKARTQIAEADLVILVASWKAWSAKHLSQTIKNLAIEPQQKLVVLGKKSYGRVAIKKYLSLPDKDLKLIRNIVDKGQMEVNQILKDSLGENTFVDQHEMVCGKQKTCQIFTDKMELISFDGGHLTKEGARYTGRILFQNPILKNL